MRIIHGFLTKRMIRCLYVCMVIKYIIILFVETPCKFITAKLSIRANLIIICDLFNSHALFIYKCVVGSRHLMCRLITFSNDASQQITTVLYIKRACELNKSHISSTDDDPGLRIESFAVINLRGVSTNKTII